MTADIELLPLPEPMRVLGTRGKDAAEAWCRANVAHATAAQDAEIERLRTEVEAVWAAMPRDARYLDPPDGGCVPLHEQVRRMAADATRAERLAEALRGLLGDAVRRGMPEDDHSATEAQVALHEHEQEKNNE